MRHSWVLFGVLFSFAACGGGGGGSTPPLPNPGATGGTAPFVFVIPHPQTASRKPAIISPNTATIVLSVTSVNNAPPVAPTPAPLTITIATSPSCSTSGSTTTCSINYTVPIATQVTIQIATYDASGNALGLGSISLNTTQPITSPTHVALGGYPVSAQFVQSSLSFANTGSSTPTNGTATLKVFDGEGNLLIPPDTYGAPITIAAANDPNAALAIASPTLNAPDGTANVSNTVTVSYTASHALGATAAVTASFNGSVLATLPVASLDYSPSTLPNLIVGGSTQTVTVSEARYSGAFTLAGNGTNATYACAPSTCAPATSGGNVVFTITPTAAGSGTLQFSDASGTVAHVPFTITSSGGPQPIVGAPAIDEFTTTDPIGTNYGITLGPDGQTMWFLDRAGAEIGAVPNPAACTGTTCSISEGPLFGVSPQSHLQTISSAQDGRLYITDAAGGTDVGGMAVQSCTSLPTVACTGGSPLAFVFATPAPSNALVAPDGNLYVATNYTNVGTPGHILFQPIAGCCAAGFGSLLGTQTPTTATTGGISWLAVDASGTTMWYTDTAFGQIGFFTIPCLGCVSHEQPGNFTFTGAALPRVGASTRLPRGPDAPPVATPAPFATPLNSIISAPNGNLYLAEAGAHRIDQLNAATWKSCSGASCTFTPLVMPVAGANPQNFVVGPDGNVWFTDTTGYVGVIALSTCASGCKVYEYYVGGAPWGIAVGSDGDIWFTDSASDKIGKVILQ